MKKLHVTTIVISILLFVFSLFVGQFRFNYLGKNYSYIKSHVSIDDTINVFKDINENNYDSIFDNYTFKYAKKLNEQYKTKFSFYVFFEKDGFSLSDVSDKYKDEFKKNNSWMKFQFHGYDEYDDYGIMSLTEFSDKYHRTMQELIRIVGKESIDSFTRLSMYKGSNEILRFLKTEGLQGLFTANDERNSYFYSEMTTDDYFYDESINMSFIKTDLRLENSKNPYLDLYHLTSNNYIEVFTHEWLLDDGKDGSVWKLEEICRFFSTYKVNQVFFEIN